jgi:predicted short-subunit dehydrogenase-like oxidoreductase (DUF2520 family)
LKRKSKYKSKKITLIGAGKVGSILYHSLKKSGYKIQYIVDINLNSIKKITSNDRIVKISKNITKEVLLNSDVIIFAVQEKSLIKVIEKCAKLELNLRDKIVFHTSGIELSDLFNILKVNLIKIGSFHPLQTFNIISYKYNNILENIYFGIEGGTEAIKYFKELCKSLKSKYLIIPKNKKVLYHSACVIASNFLVSHFNIIFNVSKNIFKNNKEGIKIFKPIVMKTLDNIFSKGIEKSLTGPFERGDINTINLHLKYFKENLPSQLYYYILLGLEAMNLSKEKRSITKIEAKEIEKLLLKHI